MTIMFKNRLYTSLLLSTLMLLTIPVKAQQVTISNNLLYDATLTPNIGVDVKVDSTWSVGANFGLNAWDIDKAKNKKWRHLLVAPHVRKFMNFKESMHRYKAGYENGQPVYKDSLRLRRFNYLEGDLIRATSSTATSMWATPACPSDSTAEPRTAVCRVTCWHWEPSMATAGYWGATGGLRRRPASLLAMPGTVSMTVPPAATSTASTAASSSCPC